MGCGASSRFASARDAERDGRLVPGSSHRLVRDRTGPRGPEGRDDPRSSGYHCRESRAEGPARGRRGPRPPPSRRKEAGMAEARLGVGILGAGRISRDHAFAAIQADALSLVAVSDPDVERAERFAARHRCKAYTDPKGMLARDDVDLVIAGIPHGLHGALGLEVLEAGEAPADREADGDDARGVRSDGGGGRSERGAAYGRAHPALLSREPGREAADRGGAARLSGPRGAAVVQALRAGGASAVDAGPGRRVAGCG